MYLSNGKNTIVYNTPHDEIAFHVSILMPNSDDPQQIMKKRHIGNDYIHIVWDENITKYDTMTIKSQFNLGHVIIQPISNNLFRLTTKKKHESISFVPLNGSILIPKNSLPFFARIIAIIGDSSVALFDPSKENPQKQSNNVISNSPPSFQHQTTSQRKNYFSNLLEFLDKNSGN